VISDCTLQPPGRAALGRAQRSLYCDRMVRDRAEREVELEFGGGARKKANAEKFMDMGRGGVVLRRASFRILHSAQRLGA
jgi:hypothetical protein